MAKEVKAHPRTRGAADHRTYEWRINVMARLIPARAGQPVMPMTLVP